MEKLQFTNIDTTKEQYLKFKEYIKKGYHDHSDYVAYYIFKHRITGEDRDKYLDDEVRHRCYKGLYSGRIISYGGALTEKYGIPTFKNWVIKKYNEFAESDGEEK